MTAYVDTSVLLRVVLGEPSPLRQWRSSEVAISSELIRVEALRSIDRGRVVAGLADADIAERRASVLSLLEGFHLAAVTRRRLTRARLAAFARDALGRHDAPPRGVVFHRETPYHCGERSDS